MFDIITFGGAVVDAFLETGLPETHGNMCYTVGAKIAVKELKFSTGGGATNTATTFSKLGLKTGAIIKVGDDLNSKMILDELKKYKIIFLGKKSRGNTDFSVILDSKEHNRTVLTYKEKSNSIALKDIPLAKLKTKWFYFSALDGVSLETQKKLLPLIKKNKIKLAYNPSSYLTIKGPSHIKEILAQTNVLILNNDEAKDLIPKGDLFKGLHELGPEIVCITYGKEGNIFSNRKVILKAFPRKIKVAERTGAGDAFASGFVSGLIKTNDFKTAIKLGSLNAESVIQKPGAKNGILSWKEASHQLKTENIKIIKYQ